MLLIIIPAVITYYSFTFGLWAWRDGNRGGGAGVFFLASFEFAMSVYAIFIRTGF
ncbi:MAG: hypothetical protein M1130_08115 [Actinobacteria bacterium]|nr:hypothetical protein [Actinomycetota bacterium]